MRKLAALVLGACASTPRAAPAPAELQLAPLSEATRPAIAVLGLEGTAAVQTELVRATTEQIRAVVDHRDDLVLVAAQPNLGEEKLLHQCTSEDAACLAMISADVGAPFVLFGHVDSAGTIDLELYGAPANRVTAPALVPLGAMTERAVERVLDGYLALCRAQLELEGGALAGAMLRLDHRPPQRVAGRHVEIGDLPAGPHRLVVAPAFGEPLVSDVDLPCYGARYHVTRAP